MICMAMKGLAKFLKENECFKISEAVDVCQVVENMIKTREMWLKQKSRNAVSY